MASEEEHSHHHASPGTARGRLAIAFGITSVIVLAQALGSVVTGSLALLTDTAHVLVDASGLLVALIAGIVWWFINPERAPWIAAAILIGAAIAPPDPVAVDAVAEPAGIPRR